MRPEVLAFAAGGPLPGEHAHEDEIDRRERQLRAISRPVTAEEARVLALPLRAGRLLGVAWSLLQLIEGPKPVLTEPPDAHAGPWRRRLWQRAANAGLVMAEEAGGGGGGAIRS
ncbi:hypothetical protein [Streptomyces sp. NPDC014006]|uniref:hypothetical protein n=1 Tax=Streptomyces sp. NPDC014006 TaxID=3364870 RepID=UPI0036F88813